MTPAAVEGDAAAERPPAPRVAFQGEAGAFGEAAIRARWGDDAEPIGARTFDDVISLVCSGAAEYGVLPVRNSTIGEIAGARLALEAAGPRVAPVGEIDLPVRHCLLALPGTTLSTVRLVGSHPAALEQCARFFQQHPRMVPHPAFDTAGAARELAELPRRPVADGAATTAPAWFDGLADATPQTLAVVAGAAAAARYGLAILAEGIEDDPTNTTHFLVVRRREGA